MKMLSIHATAERVGVSKTQIYRLIEIGNFPKPVRLSQKRTAWVEAEVEKWLQERIDERDTNLAVQAQSGAA